MTTRANIIIEKSLKRHFLMNCWSKFKITSHKYFNVPHKVLFQNNPNGSSPPNKMAARANNGNLLTTSTENSKQFQTNIPPKTLHKKCPTSSVPLSKVPPELKQKHNYLLKTDLFVQIQTVLQTNVSH